jgi:hypothetical protein
MESFQSESIHVDCPIVPIEVFGNLADRIEYSLTHRLLTFHRSVRTHGNNDLETRSQLINSSIDLHMAVLRILTEIAEKLGGQSDDSDTD